MKRPRLSLKNGCLAMTIICGAIVATVVGVVPASSLGLPLWKWTIVSCGILCGMAAIIQAVKQSLEDHDLGNKINRLLADRFPSPEIPSPQVPLIAVTDLPQPKSPDIDGELYRLSVVPRTAAWEIIKAAFKMHGQEDEAAVDCDVLIEMYLVNKSVKDKYVRELRLSAEISGVRTNFALQNDFRAADMIDKQFEYSLDCGHDFYAPDLPLSKLFTVLPLTLSPQQPAEGWVRFFIKEINPDKVDRNTWQVSVVDSVGNEFPITKIASGKREGEVSIRRLRG